jgi:hypothetical protein
MLRTFRSPALLVAIFLIAVGGAPAFAQNDPHHPGGTNAAVLAQENPTGMRDGMMGMMRGGGMIEMMESCGAAYSEGRIAFLKAELAITDQQKGAWEAYAAAIKKNLEGMQGMHATMMKVTQAKSPVERLDAHVVAMESRLAVLKELKPALGNLYSALSEDQKKKADELLTGMGCMM